VQYPVTAAIICKKSVFKQQTLHGKNLHESYCIVSLSYHIVQLCMKEQRQTWRVPRCMVNWASTSYFKISWLMFT